MWIDLLVTVYFLFIGMLNPAVFWLIIVSAVAGFFIIDRLEKFKK